MTYDPSVPSMLHMPTEQEVAALMRVHFDSEGGARYWIEYARSLGVDPLREVSSFSDLKAVLGFRDAKVQEVYEIAARTRPLEDFIPRSVRQSEPWIWASETGGTTGLPKRGCWDSTYWEQVMQFSDEFLDLLGVPRGRNWMFIGPTGPHTTGRLIISLAERRGGLCYSIDLDPRIVKIFLREGQRDAADRYVRHIWDQVKSVMNHQNVGILFCTSKLLEMITEYISPMQLASLEAVLHAGTTMTPDTQKLLKIEVFPSAPIIGIYGTSTTGISFQAPPESANDFSVTYVPCSPYVVLEPIGPDGNLVPLKAEGDLRTWRLTKDSLIPGFIERDRATRIAPYGDWADRYPWDWIRDPYSPQFTQFGEIEGVY